MAKRRNGTDGAACAQLRSGAAPSMSRACQSIEGIVAKLPVTTSGLLL